MATGDKPERVATPLQPVVPSAEAIADDPVMDDLPPADAEQLAQAWVEDLSVLPPDQRRDIGPPTVPNALAVLVALAALLVIANGIGEIRDIVAASFLALNLVIVVWPVQKALARALPRFLSAIIAGLLAIGLLLGLLYALGWAIARLIQTLPTYSEKFQNLVNQISDWATELGLDTSTVIDTALDQITSINVTTIIEYLSSFASALGSAVWLIALVVLILVFMTMDSASFSDRMKRLADRHNATLAWALNTFAKGVRRYWVVATIFGLIVAGFDWILLTALAVPLAGVWAVFSFVTNFIPNVGFVIGLIPPVLMAFLAGGPMTALWVAIGYTVLNVVIQGIIQPRVTGEAVGITATVAILSLLVWATVLGGLGTILAIPATLLLKTLFIDVDPKARWANALIAANPRTSDEDPIKLSEILDRAKRLRKAARKAPVSASTADLPDEDHPFGEEDTRDVPAPAPPPDMA
jgi:predicted PurR-regulated permease PerM